MAKNGLNYGDLQIRGAFLRLVIFASVLRTVTKILVVRFSSIGDIVLTSPVVRCLKQQLEGDVEIHFLTKKVYESILQNNVHISRIFTIEKSTDEVINSLKEESYDYIIDLHKNLRSKRVIRKLKRLSFSFNKLNYRKWLLTRFKVDKLPDIHVVDRYFGATKTLGVENDKKGLEYFIGEEEVDLKVLPEDHRSGYISFAIGAQHETKKLPIDKIVSICQKIDEPIVLLGGPSDVLNGKEIVIAVGPKVYNACGKYTINESASLVRQSACLITHDTGLMHIGVALGVKVVSIWGSTVPAFGMYPYYQEDQNEYSIIENKELECRPCSKIGYKKCPKGHFKCMKDISERDVLAAVKS